MPKKITRPGIDEALLMNIVGGGAPMPVIDHAVPTATSPEPPQSSPESSPSDTRRRKTGIPDYETTFVHILNIRSRDTVYVRSETKKKLTEIIQRIGGDRMNIQSYIELIFQNHIETYRDEINRLAAERSKQTFV